MPGKVILLLPAFLALMGSLQSQQPKTSDEFVIAYQKADHFFNSSSPTATTDSLALAGFNQLIRQLAAKHNYDSVLFQCQLKRGILLDVANQNDAAKDAYLAAASLVANNKSLNDSLLFKPCVYAGTNYFNLNNFDSANYLLIKAEGLLKRFPQMPETERLYNTLGALHYANGNYLQSKNYFMQALAFIKNRQPYDKVFALGLQANIATSFYKLGQYTEALDIYRQIIKEKIPATYIYNGICMNMGKAYAAMQQYREALQCFKKIDPAATPGVLNEQALAYYEMRKPDSAAYYLDQLTKRNSAGDINVLDAGINDLYRAGMQSDQQQYLPALKNLQHAISIFAGHFNNTGIYSNPGSFTGSYTYYRLFDALCKKAEVFALLYRADAKQQYLAASLDAYKAAITLLSFIEKSYDTDDAKLFLKKKSQDVYGGAIRVCLQLQQLQPNSGYLEEAFMITEKGKASIMAANLQQKNGVRHAGIDPSFLQAERNIKFAIARLDVKAEQLKDNAALEKLATEKAGYEIELSRLQKQMEQNDHYFQLKYEENHSNIAELRKYLKKGQAVFSFFATTEALHVFAFTSSDFRYACIHGTDSLQTEITAWVNTLKTAGDGKKFNPGMWGQRLYTHLVKPMQLLAPGADEWIVIPDGSLCLLPFESLPDGNSGKTLLQTTTISYQFSTRFIPKNLAVTDHREPSDILSFAPFAAKGADYKQPGYDFIGRLPGSGKEIEALKGIAFLNQQATKTNFLQRAGSCPIIHLATHAVADPDNPAASFIAFYPEKNTPQENCLYLEEIYGLNLDACKLVIVSACETGKGELVNNEGVMSLGRAFAYAGCEASINSLWQADDKATTAILRQFHVYLQQGYSKSKALQKAKLDYISSDALYKSPAYWANLVITGNTDAVYPRHSYIGWITTAAGLGIFITGMATRRRRKKSRRFSLLPVQ